MHWIYLIHEFHNLSWITEINELFHDIIIYWDAPECFDSQETFLIINFENSCAASYFCYLFEINILQNNDLRLLTLEIKSKLNLETTNSLKIMLLLKETIMLDLFLHFQFISWEQKKMVLHIIVPVIFMWTWWWLRRDPHTHTHDCTALWVYNNTQ